MMNWLYRFYGDIMNRIKSAGLLAGFLLVVFSTIFIPSRVFVENYENLSNKVSKVC